MGSRELGFHDQGKGQGVGGGGGIQIESRVEIDSELDQPASPPLPLSSLVITTIPASLTGMLLLADQTNGLVPQDSLDHLPLFDSAGGVQWRHEAYGAASLRPPETTSTAHFLYDKNWVLLAIVKE